MKTSKMNYIYTLGDYLSMFGENIQAEDFIFIDFSELQVSKPKKALELQLEYKQSRTEITLPGEYLSIKHINCKNSINEIIKKWNELENVNKFPLSNITRAFIKIDSSHQNIIREYVFTSDTLPSWHFLVKLVDLSISCEEIPDFDKKLKKILEEPSELADRVCEEGESAKEFYRSIVTGISELIIISSLYNLYNRKIKLVDTSNEKRPDISISTENGEVLVDVKAKLGDFSLKSGDIKLDHQAVVPVMLTYVAARSKAEEGKEQGEQLMTQNAPIVFLDVSYSFYGYLWRKIAPLVNVKGNFSFEHAICMAIDFATRNEYSIVFFTEYYGSGKLLAYTLSGENAQHIGYIYVDKARAKFRSKIGVDPTPYEFIKIINNFTIKVQDMQKKLGKKMTYEEEIKIMKEVIDDFLSNPS